MCVIAASRTGERQPTFKELQAMFNRNPHGAGYMHARDGRVYIHKGFMRFEDFARCVRAERFTADDAVVYHFRISTQAGVNPEMTQPFPLTKDLPIMRKLDVICSVGIAHNGIIPVTTDPTEKTYSDTALFIADYLTLFYKRRADLDDWEKKRLIQQLIGYSKLAILSDDGGISTVGDFYDDGGLLLSNTNHKTDRKFWFPGLKKSEKYSASWEF